MKVWNEILVLKEVSKHFRSGSHLSLKPKRIIRAVDDISFVVREGETFGIVGESGCGKTTLAKCIVGIYPPTKGKVLFEGKNLWSSSFYNLNAYRDIQLIFQDQSCLNPRMTLYDIVTEPLEIYGISKKMRPKRFLQLMELVHLDRAFASKYPNELSGGEKQRAIIARALVLRPKLAIADEPVSKLDVSIQAHILNLIKELKQAFSMTLIYISHDLATVEYLCESVAVMYLGQIVELGSKARALFRNPYHPYTRALVSAVPSQRLLAKKIILRGSPPDPANVPQGCRFHTRCPYAQELCKDKEPPLQERKSRLVRCHFEARELYGS